jgi:hypothetical protein
LLFQGKEAFLGFELADAEPHDELKPQTKSPSRESRCSSPSGAKKAKSDTMLHRLPASPMVTLD